MAKISSYSFATPPTLGSYLIGTLDVYSKDTKNFRITDVLALAGAGLYVPYTGATANVNLGSNSITANQFIKLGGTSSQFLKADGSIDSNTYVTSIVLGGYVPYTGATEDVNLLTKSITASSFIKLSGLPNQFLKADGSIDSNSYLTSLAASTAYVPYTGANQNILLGFKSLSGFDITASNSLNANGPFKVSNDAGLLGNLLMSNGPGGAPSWTSFSTEDYVPYTGATGPVDLGDYNLTVNRVTVGGGTFYYRNTILGEGALSLLDELGGGGYNTAIGTYALFSNTIGSSNTAIGTDALKDNIDGYGNIAIGVDSLVGNVYGSNNIAIGSGIGNSSSFINTITIGNSVGVAGDYVTSIGNPYTLTTVIYGNLVLGSTADDTVNKLQVTGKAAIYGDDSTVSAVLGDELLTTGTGAGWTGTDFASGYTHVSGTAPLQSTLFPNGNFYQIKVTITGRTAGSFILQFGDLTRTFTSNYIVNEAVFDSSTNLKLVPSSDFNGTVTVSVKTINAASSILNLGYYYSSDTIEFRSISTNTFIGASAGRFAINTMADYNTFLGGAAGNRLSEGTTNTLIGYQAGGPNFTQGVSNIIIGSNGLYNMVNGIGNISIGSGTNLLNFTDTNYSIIIGDGATGLGSNTTILGTVSTTKTAIIGNLLLGGTINHNAKLDVTGPSLQNGNIFFAQPTPSTKTATSTLTIAELLTSIVTTSGTVAMTLTLPTGTLTDAGTLSGLLPIDNAFDWVIINRGTALCIVTIAAATGNTFIGLATIPILSQATFRTRKTAANTFVTYRIA